MIDDHGLLGAVRDRGAGGKEGLFGIIKGWDVRGEDVVNLMRGRFSQFRHRKERRLFDMMDRDHTGYVTLEEIIAFREHHEEADELAGDVPLLTIQPDLTRSLVALYHFDVHLDGHLNFDEFILMQDYLQKVERTLEDEEVICCCIPKTWFKRKRVKKKRRGGARGASEESSAPMHGNSERVIARKVALPQPAVPSPPHPIPSHPFPSSSILPSSLLVPPRPSFSFTILPPSLR